MNSGFDSLSLAIFTTLTPAGVVAFILVAIPLLFFSLDAKERGLLSHYLVIPCAFALVGFIASATHLGSPSNALHVFSGIGRSSLSNEVFFMVIFLVLAGSYWIFSFKEKVPLFLARLWLGLTCVAGIVLVAMTSFAYSVDTVVTWSSWTTPVGFWLSALLTGPVIGVLTCFVAQVEVRKYFWVLCGLSLAALIGGLVLLFINYESLASITNYEFSAIDLVPHYLSVIVAYFICGSVGSICAILSLRKGANRKRLLLLVLSSACLLLAVFILRMTFYAQHMTAGF